MKKKVFYKLEKYYRMSRLEKMLGLREKDENKKEKPKKDPERYLKAYMTSWEGFKNE